MYFNEWKQRFATGKPERYMDKTSFKVYMSLKKKKTKRKSK